MTRHIKISPYNPAWPKMFDEEAAIIKKVLGDNCIAIHHIGSTSVPGLAAKPIIDIMPIVQDIEKVDLYNNAMKALDYDVRGECGIPFRRYFSKQPEMRTYHIHMYEHDNPCVQRHLKFRDWMKEHPEEALCYSALKQNLAHKFSSDIISYTSGKSQFIENICTKAGWDGFWLVMATTKKEWEEYHRIRKTQIFDMINVIYDPKHPTITAKNHFHFVLYKGENIITAAQVELLDDRIAILRSLATDLPYQGKGYGQTMVHLVEKWIKHQKRSIIKTHARLSAECFYRKLGYIDMHFDDESISQDVIDLGKVL